MRYLLTISALVCTLAASAVNYNAVNSGNYNDPNTWYNGIVPPVTISSGDLIAIYNNVTVSLNQDIILSNGGVLEVRPSGRILSNTANYIEISNGTLDGTGTIEVSTVKLGKQCVVKFTGTVTADELSLDGVNISTNTTWNVNQRLRLKGGTSSFTNGTINLTNFTPALIHRESGGISISGFASMPLNMGYNVKYSYPCNAGIELTGTGLTNVEVTARQKERVLLQQDVVIRGTLTTDSSYLDLNRYNLTLIDNGYLVSKNKGGISSVTPSSMYIRSNLPNAGELMVYNTVHTLPIFRNFVMDMQGNGGQLDLISALIVGDTLLMNNGHILGGGFIISPGGIIHKGGPNSYLITPDQFGLYFSLMKGTSQMVPLGTGKHYAPIKLTDRSSVGDIRIYISLKDEILADGSSGSVISNNLPCVQAAWYISGGQLSEKYVVDAEVFWETGMEVNRFDDKSCYLSEYDNNGWPWSPPIAANQTSGMKSLIKTDIKKATRLAVFGTDPTSVHQISDNAELSIAPNPAANYIVISNAKTSSANIYDVTGRAVRQLHLQQGNNRVDVSALQSGMYYLMVEGGKALKFVKQ